MMPRLPEKEAQLVDLLWQKPQTIDELRAAPLVRRSIGRGYLGPMLKCLLDEDRIAVTNGVFWARIASFNPARCPYCSGKGKTRRESRCRRCEGTGKVRP